MFKKIRNPILFQGRLDKKNYFEGWYFKQVSMDMKSVIGLIPGISLRNDDPHCFIQYIFSKTDENGNRIIKTGYCRYPLSAFKFKDSPFMIEISGSIFTETSLSICISDGPETITGHVGFGEFVKIKESIAMPNIMGYFAYIPNMECYHGVVSMMHSLAGNIIITGETINFAGGSGYIEKDWGTSFPEKYIWMQCSHFANKTAGIIVSVAKIPFMGHSFQGYLCNMVLDGNEYRFATYNGSRMNIEKLTSRSVGLSFENRKAKILIEAVIFQPGELIAPNKGKMDIKIKEELSGEVKITLYDKKAKSTYTDTGKIAGIEIVGY